MTEAEKKVYYWSLILRANKVGKSIPAHWLKYGPVPTSPTVLSVAYLDVMAEKVKNLFERDSTLYASLKKN